LLKIYNDLLKNFQLNAMIGKFLEKRWLSMEQEIHC
jgi:hypothetical protein